MVAGRNWEQTKISGSHGTPSPTGSAHSVSIVCIKSRPFFSIKPDVHLMPTLPGLPGGRCATAKCPDSTVMASEFCQRHACTHAGCTAGRHEEEAYCEEHLPCKQDDCARHRVKKGGKLARFCDAHHECGDHMGDDNHKCKSVLATDTKFCSEHRCAADNCDLNRGNWVIPENRYCIYREHRPPLSRSKFSLIDDADTCQRPQCTEQTENTGKKAEHRFCSRHTCQRKRCLAEVRSDDALWPFCGEHDMRLYAFPPTLESEGSSIADEDSYTTTRRRYENNHNGRIYGSYYALDPRLPRPRISTRI